MTMRRKRKRKRFSLPNREARELHDRRIALGLMPAALGLGRMGDDERAAVVGDWLDRGLGDELLALADEMATSDSATAAALRSESPGDAAAYTSSARVWRQIRQRLRRVPRRGATNRDAAAARRSSRAPRAAMSSGPVPGTGDPPGPTRPPAASTRPATETSLTAALSLAYGAPIDVDAAREAARNLDSFVSLLGEWERRVR